MMMEAFWDSASCSLVEADRRFVGAYCLHHQGARPQEDVIFILAAVRTTITTVIGLFIFSVIMLLYITDKSN
jgi:hypothetical protein